MFNTPILFLIFNRPVETQIVFDRIKEIKPKQLFVAFDGARKNNFNDYINCKLSKDILNQIDWDCEVKTLYRELNLGCGKAVLEAITWFFSEVEQGIILEDDCLPNHSLFLYSEELLEKYKDNDKIFNIGGVNFQGGQKRGEASYYFSVVPHIWGWAAWRKAWSQYDFDIKDYPNFVSENKIDNYYDDEKLKSLWLGKFKTVFQKKIDVWDYQWMFTIYNQGGISIIPNQNLVTNISFGENATHTIDIRKYANLNTVELYTPFVHPKTTELNKEADYYFYYIFEQFDVEFKKKYSYNYKIKLWLSSNIEKIFSYSDSVIFSTDLIPENVTEIENWWHISSEIDQNIAFYSKQNFEFIAKKYHKNYYYKDKNIHVFTDKTFDKDQLEYLFSAPKKIFSKIESKIFKQKTFTIDRKTLLWEDCELIKNKTIF